MHHLATLEHHRKLYSMSLLEKLACVIHFRFAIVRVSLGTQPDFLYDNCVLFFNVLFFFPFQFVQILAEVHYSAHRRAGFRGDFDQVKFRLSGMFESLGNAHNPYLAVVGSYQTNRVGIDLPVDSKFYLSDNYSLSIVIIFTHFYKFKSCIFDITFSFTAAINCPTGILLFSLFARILTFTLSVCASLGPTTSI